MQNNWVLNYVMWIACSVCAVFKNVQFAQDPQNYPSPNCYPRATQTVIQRYHLWITVGLVINEDLKIFSVITMFAVITMVAICCSQYTGGFHLSEDRVFWSGCPLATAHNKLIYGAGRLLPCSKSGSEGPSEKFCVSRWMGRCHLFEDRRFRSGCRHANAHNKFKRGDGRPLPSLK